MILRRLPDKFFEIAGTGIGLLASLSIAAQIYAEFTSNVPSSLSPLYVLGFLVVFLFWVIYGLRFKRPALWVTNGTAAVLQIILLARILLT